MVGGEGGGMVWCRGGREAVPWSPARSRKEVGGWSAAVVGVAGQILKVVAGVGGAGWSVAGEGGAGWWPAAGGVGWLVDRKSVV